jgi:hypothetical protein
MRRAHPEDLAIVEVHVGATKFRSLDSAKMRPLVSLFGNSSRRDGNPQGSAVHVDTDEVARQVEGRSGSGAMQQLPPPVADGTGRFQPVHCPLEDDAALHDAVGLQGSSRDASPSRLETGAPCEREQTLSGSKKSGRRDTNFDSTARAKVVRTAGYRNSQSPSPAPCSDGFDVNVAASADGARMDTASPIAGLVEQSGTMHTATERGRTQQVPSDSARNVASVGECGGASCVGNVMAGKREKSDASPCRFVGHEALTTEDDHISKLPDVAQDATRHSELLPRADRRSESPAHVNAPPAATKKASSESVDFRMLLRALQSGNLTADDALVVSSALMRGL